MPHTWCLSDAEIKEGNGGLQRECRPLEKSLELVIICVLGFLGSVCHDEEMGRENVESQAKETVVEVFARR